MRKARQIELFPRVFSSSRSIWSEGWYSELKSFWRAAATYELRFSHLNCNCCDKDYSLFIGSTLNAGAPEAISGGGVSFSERAHFDVHFFMQDFPCSENTQLRPYTKGQTAALVAPVLPAPLAKHENISSH